MGRKIRPRPISAQSIRPPAPVLPPGITERCDEIVVQPIIRLYDETGHPIGERTPTPSKIFRATVPDVWAEIDRQLTARTAGQQVIPKG